MEVLLREGEFKMDNILVSIGPINIYWYSFLIIVAVFIGWGIAVRYAKRLNVSVNLLNDMIIYTILVAIIGARIYYVMFNFNAYRDDLLGIFRIWEGGLAIYGAVIAGGIYIFWYCKKKGLSFVKILDIMSLSLLLGQAIGRWGNFFNQEAHGMECTRGFLENMHLPEFIIEGMNINGVYYQPTFLYESIWCLIGVLILFYIRKRSVGKEGKQVSFYLIWYGIGRLVIEAMRTDSLYIGNYRISQIVSILFIVIGVVGSIVVYIKNRDKVKSVGGADGRI